MAVEYSRKNPIKVDINLERKILRGPYYQFYMREYGGYICCNKKTGQVSKTGPYAGSWRVGEVYIDSSRRISNGKEEWGTPTTGNIILDDTTHCPEGTSAVAFYHSHPDEPNLSKEDLLFSKSNNLPIVGGSVSGKYYYIYSPSDESLISVEY